MYVLGGPLILGHSHPKIISALNEQSVKGTSYDVPAELDILDSIRKENKELLANQVIQCISSATKEVR